MKKYFLLGAIIFMDLLAGTLVTYGIIPDKTNYILIPIFLSAVFIPFRLRRFYLWAGLFILYFVFNAYLRGLPLMDALKYAKYVVFPIMTFYLCDLKDTDFNPHRLLNIMIFIGVIQLPLVIIQNLFFTQLVGFTVVPDMLPQDFTTGTFWLRNDPALNFFLLCLIGYLLFQLENYKGIKRTGLIIYLTMTVLLSNSKLSLAIIPLLFFAYFIRNFEGSKLYVYIIVFAVFVLPLSFLFGNLLETKIGEFIRSSTNVTRGAVESFMSGGYSRTVALFYFYTQPLKLIGDGVGVYVDLDTNEYKLGLKGQLFIFYAEIGLLGLFYSFFICYQAIQSIVKRVTIYHWFLIFLMLAFGYTSRPFTDMSILLSFFTFARLSLTKSGDKVHG